MTVDGHLHIFHFSKLRWRGNFILVDRAREALVGMAGEDMGKYGIINIGI